MLTKCPECELQVSDKASSCPHCGYPINVRRPVSTKKKMKLPNGFGRITRINNRNMRRPYRAMITVGTDDKGRPIGRLLKPQSYFETYNEAYEALVEYNKNPYDFELDMTLKQLYEKWSDEYFEKLKSQASVRTITAAWAYCSELYSMPVKNIKARHIKWVMDNGTVNIKGNVHGASPEMKSRIKSMFNLMFDYALEYEIADKNYARMFNISDKIIKEKASTHKKHIDFTEEEMQKLWDNVGKYQYADIILIQSYSGWRPQELGLIKISDVDIDNWTFTGGMKTDAGINRTIPIHTRIRPLVKARYDYSIANGYEYLLTCDDGTTHKGNIKLTYDKYRHRFDKIIAELELNPEHRPHDPRMQFITMAKKAGVDEYAIKRIVGHAISDVTEGVYTRRDIEWIRKDIEKIK